MAVKAARGGFIDTETAVDGLTSALNAYGMATTDAQGLANKFLVTQNLGKAAIEKKYVELEKAELSKREKIRQEIADLEDEWNKKQLEKAEEAEKAALKARLDALEALKDKSAPE